MAICPKETGSNNNVVYCIECRILEQRGPLNE